jgi:hypothetical protein
MDGMQERMDDALTKAQCEDIRSTHDLKMAKEENVRITEQLEAVRAARQAYESGHMTREQLLQVMGIE